MICPCPCMATVNSISIGDAAETQAAVAVWLYGPSAATGSCFCSPLLFCLSALPPFSLSIHELPLFLFSPHCRWYECLLFKSRKPEWWDLTTQSSCYPSEISQHQPYVTYMSTDAWKDFPNHKRICSVGVRLILCADPSTLLLQKIENFPSAFLMREARKLINNSWQKYNGINLRLSKSETQEVENIDVLHWK